MGSSSTAPSLSRSQIRALTAPIEDDLQSFRTFFKDAIRTDVPLLNLILNYLWRQKGKEIRPTLVFMTARLLGPTNRRTYVAATMIELLHTATLIHDDVVDEADTRRGFLSINKLWRNKAGVLLGDFLLSKGLLIALEHQDYIHLRILSNAVRQMSEGELRQLKTTRLQNMTEERYFQIISEKTASLIAACCHCGAESMLGDGVAPSAEAQLFWEAGMKIGIAFQIKDDLLDYSMEDIGKPRRHDIRERKFTLPLIKALEQAPAGDTARMKTLFGRRRKSEEDVERIVGFVHANGGISSSVDAMRKLMEEAVAMIESHPGVKAHAALDPSPLAEFKDLLRFIMERSS